METRFHSTRTTLHAGLRLQDIFGLHLTGKERNSIFRHDTQ